MLANYDNIIDQFGDYMDYLGLDFEVSNFPVSIIIIDHETGKGFGVVNDTPCLCIQSALAQLIKIETIALKTEQPPNIVFERIW